MVTYHATKFQNNPSILRYKSRYSFWSNLSPPKKKKLKKKLVKTFYISFLPNYGALSSYKVAKTSLEQILRYLDIGLHNFGANCTKFAH